MTTAECKERLRRQARIERKLRLAGLIDGATTARMKACMYFHGYRRRLREDRLQAAAGLARG